jgi:uncharacterized protein (TIGR02996 family)
VIGDLRDSFVRDIAEHPHDHVPRLVYADFLEEELCDSERANFVRNSVELRTTPHCVSYGFEPWNKSLCRRSRCRHCYLTEQVHGTWSKSAFNYPRDDVGGLGDYKSQHYSVQACHPLKYNGGLYLYSRIGSMSFYYTGGFCGMVCAGWKEWVNHRQSLVSRLPLVVVNLHRGPYNMPPGQASGTYRWDREQFVGGAWTNDRIPPQDFPYLDRVTRYLFRNFRGTGSWFECLEAMSQALINTTREELSMEPLTVVDGK